MVLRYGAQTLDLSTGPITRPTLHGSVTSPLYLLGLFTSNEETEAIVYLVDYFRSITATQNKTFEYWPYSYWYNGRLKIRTCNLYSSLRKVFEDWEDWVWEDVHRARRKLNALVNDKSIADVNPARLIKVNYMLDNQLLWTWGLRFNDDDINFNRDSCLLTRSPLGGISCETYRVQNRTRIRSKKAAASLASPDFTIDIGDIATVKQTDKEPDIESSTKPGTSKDENVMPNKPVQAKDCPSKQLIYVPDFSEDWCDISVGGEHTDLNPDNVEFAHDGLKASGKLRPVYLKAISGHVFHHRIHTLIRLLEYHCCESCQREKNLFEPAHQRREIPKDERKLAILDRNSNDPFEIAPYLRIRCTGGLEEFTVANIFDELEYSTTTGDTRSFEEAFVVFSDMEKTVTANYDTMLHPKKFFERLNDINER